MTEQFEKILESSDYIKNKFPKSFKPLSALIIDDGNDVLKGFKEILKIDFSKIPNFIHNPKRNHSKILLVSDKENDIIVYNGRNKYHDGIKMREIGHAIYVLKYLGINKIISVDEVGHLNPRFKCGELALIYDHINLMGDNPLIGKNDDALGLRFPDMSNAYDKKLYQKVYEVLQEKMIKINEAVYLGTTGPQSETDAEARFYRDIGSDVVGYSIVPENITAVHCGISFIGIGLITRELVADKMIEDERSEKQKIKDQKEYLKKAEKKLDNVLRDILKAI